KRATLQGLAHFALCKTHKVLRQNAAHPPVVPIPHLSRRPPTLPGPRRRALLHLPQMPIHHVVFPSPHRLRFRLRFASHRLRFRLRFASHRFRFRLQFASRFGHTR
ncbi:hypothetical protein GNI_043970, partial [Gregarina niphandrodes]